MRSTLVVAFGAGGAADRAARAFAYALPRIAPVVENLPGEGGLAGVRRGNALAREGAPVLLLATPSTHILLPARLGPSAAPDDAFAPLACLGEAPNVLLASPRLGVRTFDAWLDRARAGCLAYASAGTGQTIHLCTAYLCALAGIRMEHRPYDAGSAQAYGDLAAGRVQVYFDNLLGCREAIAWGDAIALAVSADERSPSLPGVPTLAELGFPAHALEIWFGVFGANLPMGAVEAIDACGADRDLAASLAALGLRGGVGGARPMREALARSRDGWQRALAASQ